MIKIEREIQSMGTKKQNELRHVQQRPALRREQEKREESANQETRNDI